MQICWCIMCFAFMACLWTWSRRHSVQLWGSVQVCSLGTIHRQTAQQVGQTGVGGCSPLCDLGKPLLPELTVALSCNYAMFVVYLFFGPSGLFNLLDLTYKHDISPPLTIPLCKNCTFETYRTLCTTCPICIALGPKSFIHHLHL